MCGGVCLDFQRSGQIREVKDMLGHVMSLRPSCDTGYKCPVGFFFFSSQLEMHALGFPFRVVFVFLLYACMRTTTKAMLVTDQICKYRTSKDEDQLHRNKNLNSKQTKESGMRHTHIR